MTWIFSLVNLLYKDTDEFTPIPLDPNWVVLATSRKKWDGYNGSAYYNQKLKQIVIAHRGTKLTNIGSIWADVQGIYRHRFTSQMKSAFLFTQFVMQEYGNAARSISVTGHSLGGWLAQTSSFLIKYPKIVSIIGYGESSVREYFIAHYIKLNFPRDQIQSNRTDGSCHLHTVTFDSPGSEPMLFLFLDKLDRYPDDRLRRQKQLNDLDVSIYFSTPNAINSCNRHIGTLYIITDKDILAQNRELKISPLSWWGFIKYTLDSHGILNMVRLLQRHREEINVNARAENRNHVYLVKDWPSGISEQNQCRLLTPISASHTQTEKRYLVRKYNPKEFRTSVFNFIEICLLENIVPVRNFLREERKTWSFLGFELQNELLLFDLSESFDISGDLSQIITLKSDNSRFEFDSFVKQVRLIVRNQSLVDQLNSIQLPSRVELNQNDIQSNYVSTLPKLCETLTIEDSIDLISFLESDIHSVLQLKTEKSTFILMTKLLKIFNTNLEITPRPYKLIYNHSFIDSRRLSNPEQNLGKLEMANKNLNLLVVECLDESTNELIGQIATNLNGSKKLILLTSMHSQISFRNEERLLVRPLNNHLAEISFQELATEQQESFLESNVIFQGESIRLCELGFSRDILSNMDSSTLVKFLKKEGIKFGSSIPELDEFDSDCYISRDLKKSVFNGEELKQLLDQMNGRSLSLILTNPSQVSADEILGKIKPSDIVQPGQEMSLERVTCNVLPKYIENMFEKAKVLNNTDIFVLNSEIPHKSVEKLEFYASKNMAGFWFKYENGTFEWVQSFGNVEFHGLYSENDILIDRLVLISDVSGMGKSTLLKQIVRKKRTVSKSMWVVFLDLLIEKDKLLNVMNGNDLNLKQIVEFFIDFEKEDFSREFTRSLFKQALLSGNLTFIFDSFDETSQQLQNIILSITQILREKTIAHVWIATRIHDKHKLANAFEIEPYNLCPIDSNKREDLLGRIWTNSTEFIELKFDSINSEIVRRYAINMFDKLPISLSQTEQERLYGTPLHIKMLGLISTDQFIDYYRLAISPAGKADAENHLFIFKDIVDVYQEFVAKKYDIYFRRRQYPEEVMRRNHEDFETLSRELNGIHECLSFRLLYPTESEGVVDLETSAIDDAKAIRVNIINSIRNDNVNFLHRSFAEYFVANTIFNSLNDKEGTCYDRTLIFNFLKNNYFSGHFENIRIFLDLMLARQVNVHNCIFEKIIQFKSNRDFNIYRELDEGYDQIKPCVDLLGRSVLHYLIRYGDKVETSLWSLLEYKDIYQKKDKFDKTFVEYDEGFQSNLEGLHKSIILLDKYIAGEERIVNLSRRSSRLMSMIFSPSIAYQPASMSRIDISLSLDIRSSMFGRDTSESLAFNMPDVYWCDSMFRKDIPEPIDEIYLQMRSEIPGHELIDVENYLNKFVRTSSQLLSLLGNGDKRSRQYFKTFKSELFSHSCFNVLIFSDVILHLIPHVSEKSLKLAALIFEESLCCDRFKNIAFKVVNSLTGDNFECYRRMIKYITIEAFNDIESLKYCDIDTMRILFDIIKDNDFRLLNTCDDIIEKWDLLECFFETYLYDPDDKQKVSTILFKDMDETDVLFSEALKFELTNRRLDHSTVHSLNKLLQMIPSEKELLRILNEHFEALTRLIEVQKGIGLDRLDIKEKLSNILNYILGSLKPYPDMQDRITAEMRKPAIIHSQLSTV